MDQDAGTILDRAVHSWEKAQVFHQGPTMGGVPKELELAQRIAAEYPQFHNNLTGLLASENRLVVAYALLTLRLIGSPVLANLPEDLLSRRGKIIIGGCVVTSMDLAGLARQYQKEAGRRAHRQDQS